MIRQTLGGGPLLTGFHTSSGMAVGTCSVATPLLLAIDRRLVRRSRDVQRITCRAPKPLGRPLLLYRAWKFGMFSQTVLLVHEQVRLQVRQPFGSIIHAI